MLSINEFAKLSELCTIR